MLSHTSLNLRFKMRVEGRLGEGGWWEGGVGEAETLECPC